MDPASAAMMVISAIPQGFKMVDGIRQNRQANRMMESNVRPTYETPEEVDRVLQIASLLAGRDEMPGQGLLEDKLGGMLANQVRDVRNVSTGSAGALNAISRAYSSNNEGMRDIAIKSAQNKQDMMRYLNEVLQYKAAFTDKEWDYNERMRYDETAATASALKQAGLTNIYSGMEGLARIGSSSIGASAGTDGNGADYTNNFDFDAFIQSLPPEQQFYFNQ